MKGHRLSLLIMGVAMILAPTLGSAGGVQNVTVVELTIYMGSTVPGALVKFSPAAPGLEGCSYSGATMCLSTLPRRLYRAAGTYTRPCSQRTWLGAPLA